MDCFVNAFAQAQSVHRGTFVQAQKHKHKPDWAVSIYVIFIFWNKTWKLILFLETYFEIENFPLFCAFIDFLPLWSRQLNVKKTETTKS